jgi:hypothetical protein
MFSIFETCGIIGSYVKEGSCSQKGEDFAVTSTQISKLPQNISYEPGKNYIGKLAVV